MRNNGHYKPLHTGPMHEDPEMLAHFSALLEGMGEDPEREGLQDTPRRWLKFMGQFLTPEPFEFTVFDGEDYDEMVLVKDIPFFSLCEHHMAPFFGTAHIAYIPDGKIVGLSKLPRVLDYYARRLQNQERITQQVAKYVNEQLRPKGAACIINARHLCVEMRGIKKHNCSTVTSHLIGAFKRDASCRNELFSLIK